MIYPLEQTFGNTLNVLASDSTNDVLTTGDGGNPSSTTCAFPLGLTDTAAVATSTSILRRHVPNTVPSSVALAASNYDFGPRENYRSWLLDTGCKYDLTTRSSIPQHQVDSIFTAPMPILLATANDLVQGDKVVSQQIGELGEVAEPYVLDSTPDVLSIGRRCVEDGYSFKWEPYSLHPTITTHSGKVVTLVSRDCCPHLDDYEPNFLPAVSAVTQASRDDRVLKSVKWESDGLTYDEPKTRQDWRVRLQERHPNSDFYADWYNADSDDDYGYPAWEVGSSHSDVYADWSDDYSDDDRVAPAREVGSSPLPTTQVVSPSASAETRRAAGLERPGPLEEFFGRTRPSRRANPRS